MIRQAMLFAFPVFDITIARYLAARGVDYIAIDLDQLDQLQADRLIAQLREWTSGPLVVGISSDYEKVEIFRSYQSLDEVLFWDKNSTATIPNLKTPTGAILSIRISTELSLDLEQAAKTLLIIQDLQNFKLPQSCLGYVFNPGRETETGIFDFDELEAFLEILEH